MKNQGIITTVELPLMGRGLIQISFAANINENWAITGYYVDSSDVSHGFVRAKHGTITPFDVLGAGTDPVQGTFPAGINPEGAITGDYVDSSYMFHGFLRNQNVRITDVDATAVDNGHDLDRLLP